MMFSVGNKTLLTSIGLPTLFLFQSVDKESSSALLNCSCSNPFKVDRAIYKFYNIVEFFSPRILTGTRGMVASAIDSRKTATAHFVILYRYTF